MRGTEFQKSRVFTIILMVTLIAGAGVSSVQSAGVPELVNYQGMLTDANGDPLPTTQATLTFNIYGTATGGAPIWGPMIFDNGEGDGHGLQVRLVNGRFNVILGPTDTDGRPISQAFTSGATRYLEITVDENPPIQPRMALLTAPYAFQSQRADRAGGLSGQSIELWIEGNAEPSLVVDSDGDVGIGTTNPTANFMVNGNASIGGLQMISTYTGGDQDPGKFYVHIKTPDRTRGYIIIGGEGDEENQSESTPVASPTPEPNEQPEATPIFTFAATQRHFMIEGFAPNTRPSNKIISKRVVYTLNNSALTITLGEWAGDDLVGGYNPIVYVGSDGYIHMRFTIYTSSEFSYSTNNLSLNIFGLTTRSGRAPFGEYTVTISNQAEI